MELLTIHLKNKVHIPQLIKCSLWMIQWKLK